MSTQRHNLKVDDFRVSEATREVRPPLTARRPPSLRARYVRQSISPAATMVIVDYVPRTEVSLPMKATIRGKALSFPDAQAKFRALAEEWLSFHAGRSRIDFAHPAYQQIIGMGQVAVPYLLREVRKESGFWFTALRAIVGYSP